MNGGNAMDFFFFGKSSFQWSINADSLTGEAGGGGNVPPKQGEGRGRRGGHRRRHRSRNTAATGGMQPGKKAEVKCCGCKIK